MGPLQGLKAMGDTISEMAVSSWPGSRHDCADIERPSPAGRQWWSLHWPVVVVQLLSHFQLFAIPRTAARQASLSFTIPWSLLKLMSIESVMLLNYLILRCPLLLMPPIFPSIRDFSQWVSSLHQVAKVLELQYQSFQWIFMIAFL